MSVPQDITGVSVPFGEKVILLGGDFRQVPPVIPSPAVMIDTCLKKSPLWPLFPHHQLSQNMQTRQGEQEFSDWLPQLGNGTSWLISIQGSLMLVKFHHSAVSLTPSPVRFMLLVKQQQLHYPLTEERQRLQINENKLWPLLGEARTHLNANIVKSDSKEERHNCPVEYLHSLAPSRIAPHALKLETACMMTMPSSSLFLHQGMCKGTAESDTIA